MRYNLKLVPQESEDSMSGHQGEVKSVSRHPIKLGSLALLAGAATCPLTALAYTPPPADFFPVGVFLQPSSNFDLWKSRGVNTVVDFFPDPGQTVPQQQTSLDQWNTAAVQRGLHMIRAPRANAALDVNEKYLIAWSQPDEPDFKNINAATLTATYTALKKIDPQRPVYLNVAGSKVMTPYYAGDGTPYQNYAKAADWIANDIYPITAWNHPEWIDFSKPLKSNDIYNGTGKRLNPGTVVDVLRKWTGGKKQMAYIETSWQDLTGPVASSRGVTPRELRGEVWDAIIHGAKGITYFPQRVGQAVFLHDNTPTDVAAEITKQNSLITSLGGVINSGSDATDNTVTLSNPLLEGTWREFAGKKYLFVLNMSSATLKDLAFTTNGLSGTGSLRVFDELRSETLNGGTINDSFQPYQLHVYTTGGGGETALTPAIATSVPEPTGSGLLLGGISSFLMKRRRRASGPVLKK